MADALATMVGEAMTQEVKEELQSFIARAGIEINLFYQNAQVVLIRSKMQLNIISGNTIFEKMKNGLTQEDLSNGLTKAMINARKRRKSEEEIKKIEEIAEQGYQILTRLGEEFRSQGMIQTKYTIYMEEEGVLKSGTFSLDEFLQFFSMRKTGYLALAGIDRSRFTVVDSSLQQAYNVSRQRQTNIIDTFKKLAKDSPEAALSLLSKKSQDKIRKLNNPEKKQQAIEYAIQAKFQGAHTRGRAIETAVKLLEEQGRFSDVLFDQMVYNDILSDTKEFYKGGDFWYNGEDIQAKFINAGQKLQTIMNGMAELANIIYEAQNSIESVGEVIAGDADGAEDIAYTAILNKLAGMLG